MYQDMIRFVKDFLSSTGINASELQVKFPFRNRFTHSMRVLEWARRINAVEKGDDEVVIISAIFHDVGKGLNDPRPHSETSAEVCRNYLKKIYFDEQKMNRICHAIELHSNKEMEESELCLEERILMDADELDEEGAIAILWDALAHAKEPDASYEGAYYRILKNYEKRQSKPKRLRTGEGRRLYSEMISLREDFIGQLKFELGL